MCWMNAASSGCFGGNSWFFPLCFLTFLLIIGFFCFNRHRTGFHRMHCAPSPGAAPELRREIDILRQDVEALRRDLSARGGEKP